MKRRQAILRVVAALVVLGAAGSAWAQDADGDGHDASVDCDDTDPAIYPGAIETPADGVDSNCDGFEVCFQDGDGDGFGDESGATRISANLACTDAGTSANADDCDDTDPGINPAAYDIPGNGIDEDCSDPPSYGCYEDLDLDGYGTSTIIYGIDPTCDGPGESLFQTDCDDADPTIHPTAADPCDGIDHDCDDVGGPDSDEDLDGLTWDQELALGTDGCVADTDGDGTVDGLDCGPSDPATYPGAAEVVADGVDQDCDGGELCFLDADHDGEGTPTTVASLDPDCDDAGEATTAFDCDDADPTVQLDCDPTTSTPGTSTTPSTPPDTGHDKAEPGCGCATESSPGTAVGVLGLLLVLGRRR